MDLGQNDNRSMALSLTGADSPVRDPAAVLLAREAGYVKTSVACKWLGTDRVGLLGMRRRLIEDVFRQRGLPLPAWGKAADSGADDRQEPAASH